jgi:hypothetical protein
VPRFFYDPRIGRRVSSAARGGVIGGAKKGEVIHNRARPIAREASNGKPLISQGKVASYPPKP